MSDNMSKILLVVLGCFVFGAPRAARADQACEQKIAATGMLVLKSDPKTVCDTKPTVATQNCMVNLLKARKVKLRNPDFLEVYGLCKVDPSQEVQDCFKKNLDKAFDDPAYKGAQFVGDRCLMARKRFQVGFLHKPLPPRIKKTPVVAPAKTPGAN